MVPSVEECYGFMDKYEMLENIRAHSIMVKRVADTIARGLREAGEDVSVEIITAGALMHDIAKTACLNSGGDHAALGQKICLDNRLDEIADIVAEHVTLKSYDPDLPVSEKEIVYYADKRVNHDAVVSLEDRLKYLLIRYGKNKEYLHDLIRKNFSVSKEVEKKLFARLRFEPEDLSLEIRSES